MKAKKILVTGGAGFIGSHVVKELLKRGKQVTVIDDLSRGSLDFFTPAEKKAITFLKRDLTKEDGLLEIFEGQELVFNLAALNTGVDYDQGRTQLMFEQNMLLQMIPLRMAAKTSSVKKFIQISSASVYTTKAMEQQAPTPETADTSHPEVSKLGYALAKKMGENLATWYAENSSLQTVSARLINVYGENDHYDDLGHFIPMMIRKVLEAKKTVAVFGSGKQKRSFLYVKDAVSAFLLLAEKGKNGEIYNVDCDQEKTVREVVEAIIALTKKKITPVFDTSKPEGSQRRILDSSKLKRLGWVPKVLFSEGLQRTIKDIEQRLKPSKKNKK